MTLPVPFGHPTSLRAGNTWKWRISFTDYPVSESWVLSYALTSTNSATQEPLDWSTSYVTNDGLEWTVTIPTSATDDFRSGNYILTAFVTLSGARYSPYSAPLQLEADSASLATSEGLTHAERTWQAIKALIEGRIPADIDSYQIAGRSLNHIPFAELPKWRAHYAELVWKERNPGQSYPRLDVNFAGLTVLPLGVWRP